jgi:hypothetical protein
MKWIKVEIIQAYFPMTKLIWSSNSLKSTMWMKIDDALRIRRIMVNTQLYFMMELEQLSVNLFSKFVLKYLSVKLDRKILADI